MTVTMNVGAEAIRIHRSHVPLLLQLYTAGAVGPDPANTKALDELREAEVLLEDSLHPMAAAMAEAIAQAPLVISAERHRLGAIAASTIWAAPHGSVIGTRIDDESFELKLATSSLLPFHIFQLIQLRPLPDSPQLDVTLAADTMVAAEAKVGEGDIATARAIIAEAEVSQPGLMTAVLRQRIASWRVHSVWNADGEAQLGAASGIDCGALGHFLVTVEDEQLSIRSASFKEVIGAIRGVLP